MGWFVFPFPVFPSSSSSFPVLPPQRNTDVHSYYSRNRDGTISSLPIISSKRVSILLLWSKLTQDQSPPSQISIATDVRGQRWPIAQISIAHRSSSSMKSAESEWSPPSVQESAATRFLEIAYYPCVQL